MERLDTVRGRVLERTERAERHFKLAILGAAAVEFVFLILLLWVADLSDRTHVLILASTVMGYTMIALGLVVLGVHVNRITLRLLRAQEGGPETPA